MKRWSFTEKRIVFAREKLRSLIYKFQQICPVSNRPSYQVMVIIERTWLSFSEKKNEDNVSYEKVFEEVKSRVEEMPEKGATSQAVVKFLQRHSNLVFISGQPGIGKSTLIKRMIYEMWKSSVFTVDIVFFIQFRYVDYEEKTDFLRFLVPNFKHALPKNDRNNILRKLEKIDNVYILMDGLDEATIDPKMKRFKACNIYSDTLYTAERFIQNVIAGNILPRSKKLVTSRPHRITQLQNTDFQPKVLFTIQGLDKEALSKICSNICGEDEARCESILDYLQANPDLNSYCHTPVIGIMVIERLNSMYNIAEKRKLSLNDVDALTKKTAGTLTAIFVDALTEWLLDKLDSDAFPIKNIATFAFKMFCEERFHFHHFELEEAGVENQHMSTFLNTFLKGSEEMYFIHLMWQEFLAAVKLRLYPKKEEYENIPQTMKGVKQESILSMLSCKRFELITSRFLFGLCNNQTLAVLLENVALEKGRNDDTERSECKEMLKNFALLKLESRRDAVYLTDKPDENDVDSDEGRYACDNADDDDDRNENDFVDDVGVIVIAGDGSDQDDESEDDINEDAEVDADNSYFGSIIPLLGWVHEMGENEFTQRAAAYLRSTICIEGQFLPSDISVINNVFRARSARLALKVLYPRFLGNCSRYFFRELHQTLKKNHQIQVSTKSRTKLVYLKAITKTTKASTGRGKGGKYYQKKTPLIIKEKVKKTKLLSNQV